MINKRFFLMNASITTLVQLKALVCDSLYLYSRVWQLYDENIFSCQEKVNGVHHFLTMNDLKSTQIIGVKL